MDEIRSKRERERRNTVEPVKFKQESLCRREMLWNLCVNVRTKIGLEEIMYEGVERNEMAEYTISCVHVREMK